MEAAVEAEMAFNGGDERAARALVQENTDNGAAEIKAKLKEAQGSQAAAA
jgi:hypothetical protein